MAVILVNAELLVEMTDGPARERMAALLRNTEAAVAVLEELGHLVDDTPRIGHPAEPSRHVRRDSL